MGDTSLMKPIKGIVADASDGLWIRTESGGSMHWPHKMGLKLGTKVLIFYDFTKQRIRKIVKAEDYPVIDELKELETDEEDMEINHSQLLDMDMERRIDNT